jgi:exopolysaccharide biosynthesis polyprenyl glycosylphosphotransferase
MPETETPERRAQAAPRASRLRSADVEPAGRSAIVEAPRSAPAAEARDRAFRRLLALTDLLAVALALVLSVVVLGEDELRLSAFLALPIIVAAGKVFGLYDRDELLIRKTTMDEVPQLFQLATLYTLVFWLLESIFVDGALGNTQVLVLWGAFLGLAVVGRRAARSVVRRLTPPERLLFIGDASTCDRLRFKLDHDGVKAELVGRMGLQRAGDAQYSEADQRDLQNLIAKTDAHRIVIEPQTLPPQEMLDFVRAAKAIGVRVSLLPRILDVVGSSVVFDDLHGLTLLGVRRFGLSRSSAMTKRVFDLAGATVALLVCAPFMTVIALAIKLDTRGPVFFRQTRVGRGGRHLEICKFRTMCTDAELRKDELRIANEADGLFKIEDDPRVTRVGRLLRRTSLDELPQLLNVFAGDMSLVGPRPLVLDEDELIKGHDRRRLQLTPGMTGPWQIMGSARVPLHEMVKIDYLYVAGWSLWADMKIMLRTVPYMLARRGM